MKCAEGIILILTIWLAYWLTGVFTRWHTDMIDNEFTVCKNETKDYCCALCGQKLDFEKTQRVINVNQQTEFCCLVHEQRDIVQYIKKKREEIGNGI